MRVTALVQRLGSGVEARRRAAQRRLIAAGETAVGPLLDILCDESSPIDWGESAHVLRRIGDPAFGPLVDALAAAASPEVADRCAWTFVGLAVRDKAVYASVLTHPAAKVRRNAAYALQLMEQAAEPYLPALAGLLDDPDAGVRERAVWAIGHVGPGAVPLLRGIRRGTGRKRRAALTALADIGGWDALDEVDQRAVTRLIEVKAAHEVPAPMHLCGSWYAVPTTDQPAVLDAFALAMPRTVTMRLGGSAWNHDHHSWSPAAHSSCRRMYVTPALDGWTLVFGMTPAVAHAEAGEVEAALRPDALSRCAALSAVFGSAHWYGASCGDGWTAWCLAEAGEVVRYYDEFDPDEPIGEGHPAETHATTVAARFSVDPSRLGPHTAVAGRAVIALTACGMALPSAPGALEI